jgi:urease accessory protein
VLFRFTDTLDEACQAAFSVEDDDIGASSPAQAIASSLHETQYCRLFRS